MPRYRGTMNKQVSDQHGKLNPKTRDTYQSLSPLTFLLKLFVINSNVGDAPYSKASCILKCVISMTILGSLAIFSLYYKITYIYQNFNIAQSVQFTDTVQTIYDLFQYTFDLGYIHKYGRSISLYYFKQYECIDEILGMTYYSKIKWKVVKLIGISTFIWLVASTCDYGAWYVSFGWITTTTYAPAYIFIYLKILATLDLSSHIIHIKYRLKIIGDYVQNYYRVTESLPGFKENFISHNNLLHATDELSHTDLKPHVSTVKLKMTEECMEITWLTRCYLQLTEQVELINRMFGYRILLNSLSLLIDIVRFTNVAVRVMLGTQLLPHKTKYSYFPAVSSIMRQMTCVYVLFNLVHHCEQAYGQRDRIINTIDHLLVNKNPSEKLRTAMTELRGLMQARPISFNLAKFFRLDKTYLVSIASVVVTYTIILLQSMN